MKCLILAAGYATRLYPLTRNFPKPLIEIAGKSILDWLVDDLAKSTDMKDFIVVSNHKFVEHFEKWKNTKKNLNITIIDDGTNTNETRLGAVRDIQLVIESLNIDDDLFVIAGDNVLDFSLCGFVNFCRKKGTSCVMCYEENDLHKQQKTAIITINNDSLVTSYEEKPIEPKGYLAVPPFYFYRSCDVKRVVEALESGCDGDAPGSFAAWLCEQTPIFAYRMPGNRYDIGDLDSYNYVKHIFEMKVWRNK